MLSVALLLLVLALIALLPACSSAAGKNNDGELKYTAAGKPGPKVRTVPRHRWDSPEAQKLLAASQPVVLTDTNFTAHAAKMWSKEYLLKHWDQDADIECYVLRSTQKMANGKPLFYYTDRIPEGQYNLGKFDHEPELVQANVASMTKFLKGLEKRAANNLPNGMRMYMQTPMLTTYDTPEGSKKAQKIIDGDKCYGEQIFQDLKNSFDWTVPAMLREKHGWWPAKAAKRHVRHDPGFTDNVWVGDNGLCTPLHYDHQDGILTQIRGVKRVTIFPPSDFHAMVPLPAIHPGARGSHIYDLNDIPKEYRAAFASAKHGSEAVIGPGDTLMTPGFWWHHVEQIDDEPLPISYTLFSLHERWKDELKDEHDLMRRRLQAEQCVSTSMVATYGGLQAVEYFKALDDGRFDKNCKKQRKCARKNLQLMHDFIKDGIPDEFTYEKKPIQELVQRSMKPGETMAQWMRWMVKGRFNLPTMENPPFHVSQGAGPSKRKKDQSPKQKAKIRALKRKQALEGGIDAGGGVGSYGGTHDVPGRDLDEQDSLTAAHTLRQDL